jgi:DEAD/DEAH box helicase domain-containing protein
VIDALRGIGHALHTVAAVGLMIDPRDLGQTLGDGADNESAPRTGRGNSGRFDPTVFLFDHVPGGVGLAPRLFEQREEVVIRARALIEGCGCEDGCPACIGPGIGVSEQSATDEAPRRTVALDLLDALGVPSLR